MYIVTGAAGFIGSVIVHKLNQEGIHNIICVDRLGDDDRWKNLRGLKYYEMVHADEFIEPDILNAIFEEGVSGIYHMGACSDTTERNMDFLMKNNVEYSQILFRYATEYNVPICYASSAATYGDGELGYNDDEATLASLMPLNGYGYSKQLVDEWVLKQARRPDRWYGVKFFNVFGPGEYHKGKMSSVVYQAFNQINETDKMKLFKSYKDGFVDGGQTRDFVYVKDVVEAMFDLMHTDHSGESGIYNLGTGEGRTFADLVKATFAAMDKNENIEFIPMPEELRDQYQYFTQANMDKLKKALPDFRFASLENAVADYVKNHLMQKSKYLKIEGRFTYE